MRAPSAFFQVTEELPAAILGLPSAAPLLVMQGFPAALLPFAWALVLLWGCLHVTSRLVDDGLLVAGGAPPEPHPGPAH